MKLWHAIVSSTLFAMTFLAAPPARADVVEAPPENCVDGAEGATCHGGPFCTPSTCNTDADCDPGLVCKDKDLCTGPWDCGFGDMLTQVTGTCDQACASGSTCTTQKVCVQPSSSSSGSSSGSTASDTFGNGGNGGAGGGGSGGDGSDTTVTGCACNLARPNVALGAVGGLLLAAGLAGLGARRRHRRR